jgi:hypothetical protein
MGPELRAGCAASPAAEGMGRDAHDCRAERLRPPPISLRLRSAWLSRNPAYSDGEPSRRRGSCHAYPRVADRPCLSKGCREGQSKLAWGECWVAGASWGGGTIGRGLNQGFTPQVRAGAGAGPPAPTGPAPGTPRPPLLGSHAHTNWTKPGVNPISTSDHSLAPNE